MENNPLELIMGVFPYNGMDMPVASVIASFNEAKIQFQLEMEEMENDISKWAAKNPNKEHAVRRMEARVNRLKNMFKAYEYMMAYHKDQVNQIQRLRSEEKRKKVENVLASEYSNPVHIKSILMGISKTHKR